eukprot:TRINITY_DN88478_c0_g1_i1.p1 TRINITY_DN88478_c0_g1~~TRINITY_DN88478_c0_g1_i1.p1  ORF type:complete len:1215 (+),score=175.18 TRINITY_DN88478_c0_g1_i1:112-3645(+)
MLFAGPQAVNVTIAVCGGFSDGGLSADAGYYNEAFGSWFAKLAWDNGIVPKPVPAVEFEASLSYKDTEGFPGKAISCAYKGWYEDNAAIVLGGGWSSLTKPMAQLGGTLGGAQLDWGGTADELSDSSVYPLLSRTAVPDSALASGLAELLALEYSSSRLVVFHETGEWGKAMVSKMTTELRRIMPNIDIRLIPLTVDPAPGDEEMLRTQFRQARDLMMRHYVVLSMRFTTFQVLAEEEFSYILSESTLLVGPGDVELGLGQLDSQVTPKFKGMQIMDVGSEDIRSDRVLLENYWKSLTIQDFPEPLRSVLACSGGPNSAATDCWWNGTRMFASANMLQDKYFAWAFDASWLLHCAGQQLVREGHSGNTIRGETLHNKILNTSAIGLTGRIGFRSNGDRILSSYNLKFVDAQGANQMSGRYDAMSKSWHYFRQPTYADGSTDRPADTYPECSPGWFRNETRCSPAPPGSYVPDGMVVSAISCAAGTYADGFGSILCQQCERGRYQSNSGATDCKACDPGTFAGDEMKTACDACAEGTFQKSSGQSSCERCRLGTFMDATGALACEPCPGIRTTPYQMATSRASCVCPEEHYSAHPAAECFPCPPGMLCALGSDMQHLGMTDVEDDASFDTVVPKEFPKLGVGYYSTVAAPVEAYRCIPEKNCPGGRPGSCTLGYEGMLCAQCPGGKFPGKNGCEDCGGHLPVVWSFAFASVLPITAVGYVASNGKLTVKASTLSCISSSFGLLASMVQYIGLSGLLDIAWPQEMSLSLGLGRAFMLDLDILQIRCGSARDHLVHYIFRGFPFLSVVATLCISHLASVLLAILTKRTQAWNRVATLNTMGQYLAMLFTMMITISVIPFVCYSHPNEHQSLSKYPSILCGSKVHSSFRAVGALYVSLAMAFFCTAFWGVCMIPKWASRAEVNKMKTFRFMMGRFQPDAWYWGVPILLRSTSTAMVMLFAPSDGLVQLILMATFFTIYSFFQVRVWPWKTHSLNIADASISSMMTCLMIMGTAFVEQQGQFDRSRLKFAAGALCTGLYMPIALLLMHAAVVLCKHGIRAYPQDVAMGSCSTSPTPAAIVGAHKAFAKQVQQVDDADWMSFLDTLIVYDLECLSLSMDICARSKFIVDMDGKMSRSRRWSSARISEAFYIPAKSASASEAICEPQQADLNAAKTSDASIVEV